LIARGGGVEGRAAADFMVREKLNAATEAATTLRKGGTLDSVVDLYRRRVTANIARHTPAVTPLDHVSRDVVVAEGALECFPIGWNHPVGKKSLPFQRSRTRSSARTACANLGGHRPRGAWAPPWRV
jgi:hypothetical protein